MGFGIGRVPRDVDHADELRALLEAEKLQPRPTPQRPVMKCRKCKQTELDGAMFTTLPSANLCDDCV